MKKPVPTPSRRALRRPTCSACRRGDPFRRSGLRNCTRQRPSRRAGGPFAVRPAGSDAYPPSKSTVTGTSTTLTMRVAFASARSIGTSWPSPKPLAIETGALPVAIAPAPDLATAIALPGSHALKRTSGLPATCSFAKSSNLLMLPRFLNGSNPIEALREANRPDLCAEQISSAYRGARHLFERLHQCAVWERPMTNPRSPGFGPGPLIRCPGEGDNVQRKRNLPHDALDLLRIG